MMKRVATTAGSAIGFLVLGLWFSAALPSAAAWAQAPTAQSFGVAVNTPTASGTPPLAVLPAGGGLASDNAPSVNVAGLAGAQNAFAMASGDGGGGAGGTPGAAAGGNSTPWSVELLNRLLNAGGGGGVASRAG